MNNTTSTASSKSTTSNTIAAITAQPHAYAKRLSNPYSGVIQVVEYDKARALSLDGKYWEIQFLHEAPASFWGRKGDSSILRRYARVARFSVEDGFKAFPLHPALDHAQVDASCSPVIDLIPELKIPMEIKDDYEYWLLDETDKMPLGLLFSCHSIDEFDEAPLVSHWSALPPSQIDLPNNEDEIKSGLPPLGYRLEQLVKKRAGQNPKAQWFKRKANGDAVLIADKTETEQQLSDKYFPEYLLRGDWQSEQAQSLCQRYLARISPRLLMLRHLSHEARDKAEVLANAYAMDVEKYFHLYPAIADQERMVAIRVEARLRRSLGDKLKT
jgi:hypothetical protein